LNIFYTNGDSMNSYTITLSSSFMHKIFIACDITVVNWEETFGLPSKNGCMHQKAKPWMQVALNNEITDSTD
jgi:hypothetical protein